MDGNVLPSKLLNRLSNAAGLVRSHDFIQVYTHYDADGLASAGIIANVLTRANKEFRITTFMTLDEENMQIIRDCEYDCILIADLGASYISELEGLNKDVIVLDHHTVHEDSEKICYANPHLFGFDGMVDGCGSTMSFLFGITMDDANWDLVQIAFAGITGDKQHINGITGLNTYLLSEGVKKGFITASEGSLIPAGPLNKALYNSTEPYIRGITGCQSAVNAILQDARVKGDSTVDMLTDEEKRRLSSMIAAKLAKQGVTVKTMSELVRTRYLLRDWKMDAETFAGLLDACGRTKSQGVGIAMCLGSENDLLRAREMNDSYCRDVLDAVLALDKAGLKEMDHIQYFDSSGTGYTGLLCSVAMNYMGDPNKPTIGINSSEDKVKISGRATHPLLDKGVDLASAMDLATKAVGGEGGGHRIASGGSIQQGSEQEFLKNLNDIIGEQVNSAR